MNIKKWHYESEALFLSDAVLDLNGVDYWVIQRVKKGYLYRISDAVSPESLSEKLNDIINNTLIVSSITVQRHKTLAYHNHQKTLYRYACIKDKKIKGAYIVSKNLQNKAFDWLENVLAQPLNFSLERTIISGVVEGKFTAGKIICACKQVGLSTITQSIEQQKTCSIEQVCQKTGAGSGCGSCLPEIVALISYVSSEAIS